MKTLFYLDQKIMYNLSDFFFEDKAYAILKKNIAGKNYMDINVEIKEDAVILQVKVENIEVGNSIDFRETLSKEIEKGSRLIVLDMKKVDFIDSSGIGVIISLIHFINESKRKLVLANCGPKIITSLKTAGILELINFASSIEEALKN